MDWYSLLKVVHIVGWVSWFAGFFYLGRMFVYHREAQDEPDGERQILLCQFNLMMNRVYKIILNPAMMITWTAGIALLVFMIMQSGEYMRVNTWMHGKLFLLVLLLAYHIWCKKMIKRLENGEQPYNSFAFRLLNEFPTLFLVCITSLAVYKNSTNYLYLGLFLLFFIGMLYIGAKKYQKRREQLEKGE